MKLNKTKLAGIISLLCCTSAMADVALTPVDTPANADSNFGPFASAMSADANSTVTYMQTYAQPFVYDIGAPWTYNEYCLYDSDICEMQWKGTKSDRSDSLYAWRRNILSTSNGYNHTYVTERVSSINGTEETLTGQLTESRHIAAVNSNGSVVVGYGTGNVATDRIVRRGFYGSSELSPSFTEKGGFSAAHDFAEVNLIGSDETLIVGQSSVSWANADSTSYFSGCFNNYSYDSRYDYDDIYLCPGFNLQASYWIRDNSTGEISDVKNFSETWINGLVGNENDVTYIANAYAVNTSGFAVGFSTQNIYSGSNGGRARATIYKPEVSELSELSYNMAEISKPKTDVGGEYDKVIRDTVAVDITDTVYDADTFKSVADASEESKGAFIVVGNRTFNQPKNRSYATEFFTYNVADGSVRYPLTDNPIKGANSRVTKINNDGLAVGWRDARGEVNPTYKGSPRFQSAFLYDFINKKSVYLDDMYCYNKQPEDIRYRITNAISISEKVGDTYTILANGYDYEKLENYKNKTGSSPVVLKMTFKAGDIDKLGVCPTAENESYERQGAGMGWFLLLPLTILFRRRFNG